MQSQMSRPMFCSFWHACILLALATTTKNGLPTSVIYGTAWKKAETDEFVQRALRKGFRAFDTANMPKHYNESLVGSALKAAMADPSFALQREDLWIQTKFTPDACDGQPLELHPYNANDPMAKRVRSSFASSLDHLGVSWLDSLLLHAPFPKRSQTLEAWREMEQLHAEGVVKEIGVSNFNAAELSWLLTEAHVQPAFVQNRCLNKAAWDRDVREICNGRGIRYQGFWLLTANRHITADPRTLQIAKRHGKTPQQVLLRFVVQHFGMLALSGTRSTMHMGEDLEVAAGNFTLSDDELMQIAAIEPPKHTVSDPVKITFFNDLDAPASLFWVNADNQQEVPNGVIEARTKVQMDTFHSHSFVAKAAASSGVQKTIFRWQADREKGWMQDAHIDLKLKAEFANVGRETISVYWKSSDGTEVLQGELGSNETLAIDTHLDHVFIARNADGSIVHQWDASPEAPGTQRVEMRAEL
eukprot:TRINITY_DN106584_c0_g1_i1.p1 TRINITY_DN106584_c0_g1~~TRINITY_DN106584_c0_g1_i1.p1  ORF type:complete len:472 (+),score=93.23 TRINITY_DN106584_c0_g1_i1:55-1470(+)